MTPYFCEDPKQLYKPQFAYATPAGYRDIPYEVDFEFTIPGDGVMVRQLPHQLDDDEPFLLHAIVFPQIGTALGVENGATPGLCRIWDTRGNPLSEDLVLALGANCQSGFDSINGFGFPVEPAVLCDAGGALLFDFQLSTNAGVASRRLTGSAAVLTFYAAVYGTAGNSATIQLAYVATPNHALTVGVVGSAVTVTLATDGASAISSTFADVQNAINNTPAAFAVLFAYATGDDAQTELVTALSSGALAGGSASTPVLIQGTLLGFKRRKECAE